MTRLGRYQVCFWGSLLLLSSLLAGGCADLTTSLGANSLCTTSFTGPEVSNQELPIMDGGSQVAESFKLSAAATPGNVQLRLKAVGTPTGNLTLTIVADQSGVPDVIQLDAAQLDASKITPGASSAYYNFVFSSPKTLQAGTYWIVLKGSSNFGSSAGVDWMATNTTGAYTGGTALFSGNNGASWSTSGVNGKAFLFLLGC